MPYNEQGMRWMRIPLLVMALTAGCGHSGYDWSADAKLLRQTYNLNGHRPGEPPLMASDGAAMSAAHRIFSNVRFEGKTREEVLEILGDPSTISDYGRREEHFPADKLVYVFDDGWGGVTYTLYLKSGRVQQVEAIPGR